MDNKPLNLYGDQAVLLANGHGADIASQRADDLDLMAIEHAKSRTSTFALDIACGAGGQAIRLAQEGAVVLATDIMDMTAVIQSASAGVPGRVTFAKLDMRNLENLHIELPADIIICQRAIHYIPFADAVEVIAGMRELLATDGRLYLSASGIHSELGNGYEGRDEPLATRYAELAAEMRDRHGIHGPVCLYSEDDLVRLLESAGLVPEQVFSSKFGNIKAVAKHV